MNLNFIKGKPPLLIAGVIILLLVLHIFGATKLLTGSKDTKGIPTSADNAPEGGLHNLPVPEAVSKVRSQVAKNLSINEGVVIVMKAYEKEWSDSCLGLGGPAESCLQSITPGYEVTVQAKGNEYVYRTNNDGSVIREDVS